ncbi:hypothetical protein [Rhizobium bangladeshense]|uniref:hypothetical protein n=1 Tax=Rhizobium bangladeshense TaxID=1138189 RepID=UPI0007E56624|nr:hypothetical protein [Rhizobium bangladeshense]
MAYKFVFFIALLATALALGGAMAHLLELPNKISLARNDYFVVQKAYRGWNRLAFFLLIQLIAIVSVAIMSRYEPSVFWPAVVSALCLLGAQAVFWVYTYPANVATKNWTGIPDDWETLRTNWEYSHAAGAVCQVLAMSSLIIAALALKACRIYRLIPGCFKEVWRSEWPGLPAKNLTIRRRAIGLANACTAS